MMALQEILLGSSIAVSVVILLYASWKDYQSREVSNMVWVIYAPVAFALTLSELLLFQQSELVLYAITFGVSAGIAFLLFFTGGFGGADSKALMCIALALPFAPIALIHPLIYPPSPTSTLIFPITILGNSVLLAAASAIYMIARNIVWHKKTKTPLFSGSLAGESLGKKLVVLVTGYRMNVAKVKAKWHIFPMEDIDDSTGDLKRKLVVIPKDEGRDQIVERLENAISAGKISQYVWATPGLPMLIFVTLGLIVALFAGDLVWLIVKAIIGA
jgi:preflagellin peptidase FlaK